MSHGTILQPNKVEMWSCHRLLGCDFKAICCISRELRSDRWYQYPYTGVLHVRRARTEKKSEFGGDIGAIQGCKSTDDGPEHSGSKTLKCQGPNFWDPAHKDTRQGLEIWKMELLECTFTPNWNTCGSKASNNHKLLSPAVTSLTWLKQAAPHFDHEGLGLG